MTGMGVTAAKGFRAIGVYAGIKKQKLDLGLLVSDVPASAAGVFTCNRVRAACVDLNETVVRGGVLQAIVVNSGNANACTGEQGLRDAREMQAWTAAKLELPKETVAVASTGVIGVPLPMEHVKSGITAASKQLSTEGAELFA
jgi:glutamate N-acetyltransferase/amino-acid N-acetyltransferase